MTTRDAKTMIPGLALVMALCCSAYADTGWGESPGFAVDNEAPGIDLAIEAQDVVLAPAGPDAQATITVHNLGGIEATSVTVEVFKRSSGSFVSVGTDTIPSIAGCLDEPAAVTFTPDSQGQEIKVVASLPVPGDDLDPSNNEVIVT